MKHPCCEGEGAGSSSQSRGEEQLRAVMETSFSSPSAAAGVSEPFLSGGGAFLFSSVEVVKAECSPVSVKW